MIEEDQDYMSYRGTLKSENGNAISQPQRQSRQSLIEAQEHDSPIVINLDDDDDDVKNA